MEGGVMVEQIFFHDPDGAMIEVCTCEKLPIQPLSEANGLGGHGSFCPTMAQSPTTAAKSLALQA
jgi:hypothetical protein